MLQKWKSYILPREKDQKSTQCRILVFTSSTKFFKPATLIQVLFYSPFFKAKKKIKKNIYVFLQNVSSVQKNFEPTVVPEKLPKAPPQPWIWVFEAVGSNVFLY
jgi:hypothetical protein